MVKFKSFAETEMQVNALMASIGGNVDAYEDDAPDAPTTTFEAALATVKAHQEQTDPGGRIYERYTTPAPTASLDIFQESSGDPFIEESNDESPTREDELAFFQGVGLPHPDDAHPDPEEPGVMFDGAFWGDMTSAMQLGKQPKPIEGHYILFGHVSKSSELQKISDAFQMAIFKGEPQKVELDEGTYEMLPLPGADNCWSLYDTEKERRYVQQAPHGNFLQSPGPGARDLEEDDVFIWVIPDDTTRFDDLGYIHNKWVFMREEG